MAKEGAILTDFYSAAAICSPSRASLLTGRLPIRNGFYSNNSFGTNAYTPQNIMGGIRDQETLLPEVLKRAGYHSKLVGKWHLGHRPQFHPMNHGFDEWFGAPNCHFKYNHGPNIPVYNNKEMVGRYYEDFVIDIRSGLSNFTELLKIEALRYISQRAESKQPFFLYWTPDATHGPTYASKEFRHQSQRGSAYGDAVREIDTAIGQILDLLHQLGIANNTLVVFTSDNGAALVSAQEAGNNGPLMCGKQTTFEGGFRIPGIAWWPSRITPNSVLRKPSTHMDLFTTLISQAGLQIPNDRVIDGYDLSSDLGLVSPNDIFHQHNQDEHSVFFYRGGLLMAVRHGHYKMHLWTWTTPVEELEKGIDHCPGFWVENVTTTTQVDHRTQPIIFHLERDPQEKYPIHPWTPEYKEQHSILQQIVSHHESHLEPTEPQLNWCDNAIMNWAPPGCEKLNDCLKGPKSQPFLCDWPH